MNGIKAGLGDKAAKMVVAEASYEVSDPTVDSQILKIKDAGTDLFFSASTPKGRCSKPGGCAPADFPPACNCWMSMATASLM